MDWDDLRKLGELSEQQRTNSDTISFVRNTMEMVRESVSEIHRGLTERGYQFRNPEQAFCPPDSDSESIVQEIESRFGDIPLSLRYFWLEVGSVDFCQNDEQLIQWHRSEREAASDLQILGEEDPLAVVSAESVLNDLAEAEQHPRKRAPGAHFGWREPHMDRWYCHLACDEFHKANYSGGENYNFFIPDSSADFRIYDLWDGTDEREWFVDHLMRCIEGGGFRGKMLDEDDGFSKPLPRNKVALEIGRAITNKVEQGVDPNA